MAILTDDDRLKIIGDNLNARSDLGGSDKDFMLTKIREQQRELDAAKAKNERLTAALRHLIGTMDEGEKMMAGCLKCEEAQALADKA